MHNWPLVPSKKQIQAESRVQVFKNTSAVALELPGCASEYVTVDTAKGRNLGLRLSASIMKYLQTYRPTKLETV